MKILATLALFFSLLGSFSDASNGFSSSGLSAAAPVNYSCDHKNYIDYGSADRLHDAFFSSVKLAFQVGAVALVIFAGAWSFAKVNTGFKGFMYGSQSGGC